MNSGLTRTVGNHCVNDHLHNKSGQTALHPSYEIDDADWLKPDFFNKRSVFFNAFFNKRF